MSIVLFCVLFCVDCVLCIVCVDCVVLCIVCVVLCTVCVNMSYTTATGWQPNCNKQIYQIIHYFIMYVYFSAMLKI